ncbi:MAG: bifunctional DNA-formamidopyrimidine glycosylase/DNA-(apurinic or apyrimidinic site) lyase [Rickettsiales bacterium]|nr:bifunctional DNA-formamidopyrimidine glycosylase/DNA-(apurinic or apyrimidinic site) lyase [Rickettsiales bacterium]
MPELPEVETIKNGLKEFCLGTKIIDTIIYRYKLRYPIASNLSSLISQQYIVNVTRRAKYLVFELERGFLLFHFGMSGKLYVTRQRQEKQHIHLTLRLANDFFISFYDPRRFGAIVWIDNSFENHFLIKNLGAEPFSEVFNHKYLYKKCQKRRVSIKQLLMESKVVVGIGNIYASEILFHSNIKPDRLTNTISLGEAKRIYKATLDILKKAIEAGGTTIRDFRNPKGDLGYFVQLLSVYGKNNQNCPKCDESILKITQNNRSTYYCPQCQK